MQSVIDVVNSKLCHGCGACEYYCASNAVNMVNFPDEGLRPQVDESLCINCQDCLKVCSGIHLEKVTKNITEYGDNKTQRNWGPIISIHESYSNDQEVRFQGSSGGVCTALGFYALEKGLAGGVLQLKNNPNKPFQNRVDLSDTKEKVKEGVGSRYSPGSLCSGLSFLESSKLPVLIIGKPCEIAAIEEIRKLNKKVDEKILLTVSIFCGGTPSSNASAILCEKLGVEPDTVEDIRYRGYGWPGNASVKVLDKQERCETTYQKAWDEVLTRHKAFRCNMCPDGTGEFADISVGDPWYKQRSADYAGASMVLVRTPKGKKFYDSMVNDNAVSSTELTVEHLYKSQKGLLRRHQHVFIKVFWLRALKMNFPHFNGFSLFRNFLELDFRRIITVFVSTRLWLKKMKVEMQ